MPRSPEGVTHPTDIPLRQARSADRARDRQGRRRRRCAARSRSSGRAARSSRHRGWTAVAPAGWHARARRRGSRPPSRSRAPSTSADGDVAAADGRRVRRVLAGGELPRRRRDADLRRTASSSAGFSASGATIGPFVDYPGDRPAQADRRRQARQPRGPARPLWTLGLPYEGQHGDDLKRWLDAFGAFPDEPRLGDERPPAGEPARARMGARRSPTRRSPRRSARRDADRRGGRRQSRRADPAGHDGRGAQRGAVRRRGSGRRRRHVPASERGDRLEADIGAPVRAC